MQYAGYWSRPIIFFWQLFADALLEAEAGLVVARARAGEDLAAGDVQVAGDGHQGHRHLAVLHAVCLLVGREAPLDGAGLGGGVHARRGADLVGRNAADLGGLLGRHGGAPLGQLVEAVAPVLHEVVVVEVFLDDDVDHGHAERRVGAGAQLQEDVGPGCQPGHARIDDDEARAAAHGVHHRVTEEAVGVALERRLAPHHQDLGLLIALVVPAPRQRAGIVPFGIGGAADVGDGCQARRVAGVAGLRVAEVRRAEAHGAVGSERAALAARAGEHDDALAPVLRRDAVVLALDDVKRLVPRNLLPRVRVAAVLRVALHGMQQAGGVVHVVLERDAPRAQAALGDRVVLVAFHPHELPLAVHVQLEAASNRVTPRRRPGARARDGQAVFLVAPGLSDVVHVGKRIEFDDFGCLVELVFAHRHVLSSYSSVAHAGAIGVQDRSQACALSSWRPWCSAAYSGFDDGPPWETPKDQPCPPPSIGRHDQAGKRLIPPAQHGLSQVRGRLIPRHRAWCPR